MLYKNPFGLVKKDSIEDFRAMVRNKGLNELEKILDLKILVYRKVKMEIRIVETMINIKIKCNSRRLNG